MIQVIYDIMLMVGSPCELLLGGLVSRVMYSAVCLASEILRHLAMVGWQFGRSGYGTSWIANGIPEAFGYVG